MNAPFNSVESRVGADAPAEVKRRVWTAREIALVETLMASGVTYAQIACRIGVPKESIKNLVKRRLDSKLRKAARDDMIWRAKQIIISGYTPSEAAEAFGIAQDIAEAAFLEAYPEVAAPPVAERRAA